MALSRLLGAWIAVVAWLLLWDWIEARVGGTRPNGKPRRARVQVIEALLLVLLGGLWFGSLGAGGWWLVFGLVGALREWPPSATPALSLLRVARTVVAGGLLAWRLGPA